ncbi:flagellar hook-length control protein FliK [Roseobacteraceae bacterium NS-SX3]
MASIVAPVFQAQAGAAVMQRASLAVSAASAAADQALLLAEGEVPAETPGLSQLLAEATVSPGAAHRPETPRMIAAQLAEAFAAKGDRNVDVALNPEELGRVKMRVTTSESGIVVAITTERPETGDLMRRHISELAEEFRRMGYQDISFEFSGGSAGQTGQQAAGGDSGGAPGGGLIEGTEAALPDAPAAEQKLNLGAAGVDMRV